MADKWLGKDTAPRLFIYLCLIINLLSIAALIILVIAEFIILVNNYRSYVVRYGYHYALDGYLGDYGCGYVEYTNAPKHLGSAVWMLFYQFGLIVLCTLSIASELAWRNSSYNEWGQRYITAFYAGGLMPGSQNVAMYYFVIANGFLKLYIVALYMSQSFYGLNGGTHSDPLRDNNAQVYYTPGSTGVIYDSSAPYAQVQHIQGGQGWKRSYDGGYSSGSSGYDDHDRGDWAYWGLIGDRTPRGGMEAFAFWMGFVVLATVVPAIVAFIFLSGEYARRAASANAAKAESA